jgi:hypothetical protein
VIPPVSGIIVLFWIIRALSNQQQGGAGSALVVRRASVRPGFVNVGVRMIALTMVLPIVIAVTEKTPWLSHLAIAVLAVGSFPALILRLVLIPLGLARTAYWFSLFSPPVGHSTELRGGAALEAALALSRRRKPSPAVVEWVDRKLARLPRFRALSICAAGVLAAVRGRTDGARRLLWAVEGVSPRAPRLARRVARSWLMADAARRGAWKEVVSLGDGETWTERLRWPYLMKLVARRLSAHEDAPSDGALWWAWVVAPHRIATLSLLRQALSTRPATNEGPDTASDADGTEALRAALAAHAVCLDGPSERSLLAACRAWDIVRSSSAVGSLAARRALALETRTSGDAAVDKLIATAEADLAAHVSCVGGASPPESPTFAAASSAARRRAMSEIESIAASLTRRTAQEARLPVPTEWLEWGTLRRLCDRVAVDAPPEVQRTVFAAVHIPACNYAVWLFNVRGEKLLANSIWRWLADHAIEGGQMAALELLQKNVKLGPGM